MLNRNLGNQPALAIALNFVGRQNITETLVVMDCDGEDRPEEIALLLAAKAPGVDVVVAQRSKRSEGWRFRYFYKAYQLLFRLGTGLTIDFGNFAAFEPAALRVLDKYPELSKHLPAAILLAKLNIIKVPTERGVRLGGRSHHTLTTHLLHGLNALGVFSERVLARAIVLSFVLCGCLTVATAIGIAMKSWGTASPGWLTTVVGISLASGLQLSILVAVVFLLSNRSLSDALHSKQDFAHLIDGVQKRKGTGGNE